jgi:hypothetical protein
MPSCTTGASASGNMRTRTDQVPWSSPHRSSSSTGVGASRSRTRRASSGDPGAGYRTWYSSGGNPPKSWMVRGRRPSVTRPPGRYQWADTDRIALELLRHQRVAVAPGTAFGPAGEGWVRLSLAADTDALLEGARRLAGFALS